MSLPAPIAGAPGTSARARAVLAASIVLTIVLYATPFAYSLAWPLVLLSTLAHELFHGFAALAVGGSFESFVVYADTSGVARTAVFSAWQSAAVSAGGLVGPALTAMLFFMMARGPRGARAALVLTGVTLLAVDALLVRNLFGGVFIGFVAAVSLLIAWKAPHASQLTVVFVAVQLALSVFSRGDYLFTPVANMAAGDMPSDVANIASVLILPYWVWGALCGLISIVALLLGVASFLRLSRR